MALSYAFGGKGVDAITPDELKERREREEALQMALLRQPQNVGEGLSAIGQALMLRSLRSKNDKSAGLIESKRGDAWSKITGGLMGGGSKTSAAPSSSPAVASMSTPTSAPSATGVDVAKRLQSDFGLSSGAAAGIAGNLAHESGNFKTLQEISPTVKGSRGGYGWAQWTGPRRREFESYAKQNGLDPSSPDANYGFLSHELKNTPESAVLKALQGVEDPAQAAEIFSNKFLRPGIPHMGSRVSKASAIAQALGGGGGQQQPVQVASLDPSVGLEQAYAEPQDRTGMDAFNKPVLAPNGPQGVVQGQDITPQQDPWAGMRDQGARVNMNAAAMDNHGQVPQMPMPEPQGAPMQVAQAGQAPMPQGAPQQPQGQDRLMELMQAAQDPYLSEEQRGIVGMLLKQELENSQPPDPMKQLQMEKLQQDIAKGNQPEKPNWQKLDDDTLYNPDTAETKDLATGPKLAEFKDSQAMRKELQDIPAYKNFAQAAPIYKSMVETAGRNSRASDLNLVYGLGKIMDPTSVVREGEMVMVKNTASLPDWFAGAVASLNGGAALTPDTRNAIMTEAYSRMKSYDGEWKQILPQYQHSVKMRGMDEREVIPDFGEIAPWENMATPAPAAQPSVPGGPPQPGTVEDGFRYKGGDPADPNSWEPAQ